MKAIFKTNTLPLLLCLMLSIAGSAAAQTRMIHPGQEHTHSFAIIIDSDSYDNANEAVYTYKRMLEETEQLSTYILVNNWESPSPLREEIIRLHRRDPGLEGVVFIGKIPIAMIREGQHLTTAFKMNEITFPWRRSSVPSDRFYDDFDLVFDYLQQDEEDSLLHYYRLSEHSPQRINSDIYSARIKPMYNTSTDPYRQLSDYLYKVVADRRDRNPVNQVFSFLGHGSASGCNIAWTDEIIALSKQFPMLSLPGNSLKFMKYDMDEDIKLHLMNELQREELDLAILTMHGSPDVQHLSAPLPAGRSHEMVTRINFVILSLKAQNLSDSLLQAEASRRGIPMEWIRMAEVPEDFNPELFGEKRYELFLEDVADMTPKARMIIFNACFNGAFLRDEYMAGAYLFNGGRTVVTHGNSVNVLQNIWPQEFIGLLAKGVRMGHIRRPINTLESHIFGDPTFRFYAEGQGELNRFISSNRTRPESWEQFLEGVHPDLTAYALRMMSQNPPAEFSDMLLDRLGQSPHGSIRLECLYLLRNINDSNYHQALKMSVSDSYELVRRLGAAWMEDAGLPEFIPYLVKLTINDPTYIRASGYGARNALAIYPKEMVVPELTRQLNESANFFGREALEKEILENLNVSWDLAEWHHQALCDESLDMDRRFNAIRSLRNNNYYHKTQEYIDYAKNAELDGKLRILMIEALGWFEHAYTKNMIIEACQQIAANKENPQAIRSEAAKTVNRLQHVTLN